MTSQSAHKLLVTCLVVFLALNCDAKLTFDNNGTTIQVDTPQLWYEGYWTSVRERSKPRAAHTKRVALALLFSRTYYIDE